MSWSLLILLFVALILIPSNGTGAQYATWFSWLSWCLAVAAICFVMVAELKAWPWQGE